MKLTISLRSLLLITFLLTGCSGGVNSPSPNEAAPEKSPKRSNEQLVELEAWIIANTPIAEQNFQTILEPYLDAHPDISVTIKTLSWSTAWNDITAAVRSGDGPDILQLGSTWVPAVASMGGLADLTADIPDLGKPEDYLPASWQTTKIEGQPAVYAIPWFVEARALFYRKDAFRLAGVEPETAFQNWDTFHRALQQVNGIEIDGRKLSAIGVPGKNDSNISHNLFPWIWGAGSDVFLPGTHQSAFNNEKALDGVMFYTGLAHEGLVDPASLEKTTTQVERDFADGKSAVMMSGSWIIRDLTTSRDEGGLGGVIDSAEIGVAPLPEGPEGRATFIGGSNLAIFKNSEHREEAWDLIVHLSGDEAQIENAKLTGMLPAKARLISSPLLDDPKFAAFAMATTYGRSYPSIPQWGAVETALVENFSDIWGLVTGKTGQYSRESVKQRLDKAAREIQLILAQ